MAMDIYKLSKEEKQHYNNLIKDLVELSKAALIAMQENNHALLQEINYEMNRKYEKVNAVNLQTITWIREGVETVRCR